MKKFGIMFLSLVVTISFQSIASASAYQHYEFENSVADSSGHIDMLMPSNSTNQPQYEAGTHSTVMSFDGDDYLETNYTNISFTQFSVTGLFKYTGSSDGTIFSMGYVGNGHQNLPSENFSVTITAAGEVRARARGNTNWQPVLLTDSGTIQNDIWYHFAYVYDMYSGSKGVARLYLNGTFVTSENNTYREPVYDSPYTSKHYIGTLNEGVNGVDTFYYLFEGQLDEIKIYHSALTSTEIADEFASYEDYNTSAVPEPLTIISMAAACLAGLIRKRL